MNLTADTISKLEDAIGELNRDELITRQAGGLYHRIKMVETDKTRETGVAIGEITYTHAIPVRKAEIQESGTLQDIAPKQYNTDRRNLQDSLRQKAKWGPVTKIEHDDERRIACEHCNGTGGTGRLTVCPCLHEHPQTRSLLDDNNDNVDSEGDLSLKANFELDACKTEDQVEAKMRADENCGQCGGNGVIELPCYTCSGIGWFWRKSILKLTGPLGVAELELTPESFLKWAQEEEKSPGTPNRQKGRRQGVVDLESWFLEISKPVTGGGEAVVRDPETGYTTTSLGYLMYKPKHYPAGKLEQWFGQTFGHAGGKLLDRWPPKEPTKPTGIPVVTLHLDNMAHDIELLEELNFLCGTQHTVGFGITSVATGEVGPGVYLCALDGTPLQELSCGYRLKDEILTAIGRLRHQQTDNSSTG